MSSNGDKPTAKRRRPAKVRHVPLLMLGSDGEAYVCAPAHLLPHGVLQNPGVVVAIRLTPQERAIALGAIQPGIKEASSLLQSVLDRKLDS
jgi:hypothetical protein